MKEVFKSEAFKKQKQAYKEHCLKEAAAKKEAEKAEGLAERERKAREGIWTDKGTGVWSLEGVAGRWVEVEA